LTYEQSGAIGTWAPSELPPGRVLRQPAPFFKKLDESVVEEYARLQGWNRVCAPIVPNDDAWAHQQADQMIDPQPDSRMSPGSRAQGRP
jgi:hypothetical protein